MATGRYWLDSLLGTSPLWPRRSRQYVPWHVAIHPAQRRAKRHGEPVLGTECRARARLERARIRASPERCTRPSKMPRKEGGARGEFAQDGDRDPGGSLTGLLELLSSQEA